MERDTFDDDDWGDDLADEETCLRCGGEGTVCVCPDDICQGRGECIHGDGDVVCDECNGRGRY